MARIKIEDVDEKNVRLSDEEISRIRGGGTIFGGPLIGTKTLSKSLISTTQFEVEPLPEWGRQY